MEESKDELFKNYIIEMIKGVNSLHIKGFIHRDIKPQNFLFDKETKKGFIIDFGCCHLRKDFDIQAIPQENFKRMYSDFKNLQIANRIGTESFMPIESLIKMNDQDETVDYWAIGIILMQFLFEKFLIFKKLPLKCNYNHPLTSVIVILLILYGKNYVKNGLKFYGIKLKFRNLKNEFCSNNVSNYQQKLSKKYPIYVKLASKLMRIYNYERRTDLLVYTKYI